MMEKFQNKYRIPSARASFWNYGWNAAYFITICTKGRQHFFGEINNGEMVLSDIGEIVQHCWYEIPQHFDFVELAEFVVMPNHIHGVIIIDKPIIQCGLHATVETQDVASLPSKTNDISRNTQNQFGPQSKNLGSIVRGFKIGVTKNARQIDPDFAWQARYHDCIIRDDRALQRISAYIRNNPRKWSQDRFY